MEAVARKPKRKKPEEHVDESWLVPYADILTLLLALFIVLFASSTVDEKKLERMSAVFNQVFDGGSSFMEHPAPVDSQNPSDAAEMPKSSAYVEDQEALGEIQDNVEQFIANNELEEMFNTTLTDEGLLVTIRDSVLFNMGQAEIKDEYKPVAAELSQLLVFDPARNVVVTGHTDNIPIRTAEFSSNWSLSVKRSVNFLELLIESNPNLDPQYFSAKGYGENKPVADNNTEAGRNKNRRVEVLIQPRVLEDGTFTMEDNIKEQQETTSTEEPDNK